MSDRGEFTEVMGGTMETVLERPRVEMPPPTRLVWFPRIRLCEIRKRAACASLINELTE